MTKEVLLSISGLHYDMTGITEEDGTEEENVPIEVITPASYYWKDGKHYVVYDEVVEGLPGTIRNKIRITDGRLLEIMKSGISNAHMVFEKDKINMAQYETPYGELLVGIHTKDMKVYYPEPVLCTDNGAMIASAGYYNYINGIENINNSGQKSFKRIDLSSFS